MFLRLFAVSATLMAFLQTGCASVPPAQKPSGPPDAIEVVYLPDSMFYAVVDGGQGRFRVSDREDYVFASTHEVYARVADLLAPLRETGNTCPASNRPEPPGYIRWVDRSVSHEVPLATRGCNDPAFLERSRYTNQAFRYVYDIAERAPQPGRAPLTAPSEIKLVWLTWGNVREEWTVPRGGVAHWREPDSGEKDFSISEADFNRIRDQFWGFEGVVFRCNRVVYDMPYGRVVWSQPGFPDQTLEFDLGCVTGDAAAVLQSVEKATAILMEMRDRES
jgi:hypothetical protein